MKVYCRIIFRNDEAFNYFTDENGRHFRTDGPYRDKTDAENAAEDYAKVHSFELIWRG